MQHLRNIDRNNWPRMTRVSGLPRGLAVLLSVALVAMQMLQIAVHRACLGETTRGVTSRPVLNAIQGHVDDYGSSMFSGRPEQARRLDGFGRKTVANFLTIFLLESTYRTCRAAPDSIDSAVWVHNWSQK